MYDFNFRAHRGQRAMLPGEYRRGTWGVWKLREKKNSKRGYQIET